jgi:serine/threonine protein kinase
VTSEAESPPPEDSELDAVLRAVARPESVGTRLLHELQTVDLPIAEEQRAQVMKALQGSAAAAGEPAPGALIDDSYRLTRRLGSGGMGVVFAAQNVRTGKEVAIKWMTGRPRNESAVSAVNAQRFRREARAAARIRHPNVVDVYDVGGSDQAPYLVMELLEGESLRARLARGALAWGEAVSLLRAALSGVAAAHAQGVIHRDLKPDNIFLCTNRLSEGAPPTVKVLDFGVASMRDSENGEEFASLTRTGSVLGTPAYMPLEQLKGEPVDRRADLYALGVVLYEMLTQRLPFSARGASELAVKQATELPIPLSRHLPQLRGEREAVVMRALARRPSDRYADLAQFEEALTRARARSSLRDVTPVMLLALAALALLGGLALQSKAPPSLRAVGPATHHAHGAAPVSARPSAHGQHTLAPAVPAETALGSDASDGEMAAPPSGPRLPARPKGMRKRESAGVHSVAPAANAPSARTRSPTDLGVEDF